MKRTQANEVEDDSSPLRRTSRRMCPDTVHIDEDDRAQKEDERAGCIEVSRSFALRL